MAILTANLTLDMFQIPTTFDFIEGVPAVITPTEVAGLTPSGKLQRYFGTFDLLNILAGNYATSVVTGFQQYAGATPATALEYELTGASVNGAFLADALLAGNPEALIAEALKGNDIINGSFTVLQSGFDDFLRGLEGNDTVYGNDGNDYVQGNQGDDDLYGGLGNDQLLGDEGNDELFAGNGEDQLDGGSGNDTLTCGAQADLATGGSGSDLLNGGKGADSLDGGSGNDSIFAGQGNDTLIGGLGSDYLKDGKGTDWMTGGTGADTFSLSAGVDVVTDFSITEGDLIELPATKVEFTDSGDNVVITMAATNSFEGGVTTLLNVDFSDFNAAFPVVPPVMTIG
jgi:Ca2+-binding RTX toxin-like protein